MKHGNLQKNPCFPPPSFPQFSDNLCYSLNKKVTADCFDDKLPAMHVGLIMRWHTSFCHLYKLGFRQAQ